MKSTLILITSVALLGSVAGVGTAFLQFGNPIARFEFSKPVPRGGITSPSQPEVRPRASILESGTFDFGVMSRNERRSHSFVVANKGNDDLEINFIDKTCQCTDVTITQPVVPPGETTEIILTWQPASFNPEFEQTARFKTNDPGRIELDLTIKGKVLQILNIEPPSLAFDNVGRGQERTASCMLFSYRDEDVQVETTEWLYPEASEFFDVDIQPLDTTVVEAQPGAKAGFQVTVKLNADLPVGRFQQRLRLHFNYPDLGVREIPILGSVVGDIGIIGSGYDDATGVWSLGMLPGDSEQTRKLRIVVKGEHESPVEMSVKALTPERYLSAEVAAPKASRSVAIYTLALTVKPDGTVVNRLGNQQGEMGTIEIETSLPDIPSIKIPVSFGIESN